MLFLLSVPLQLANLALIWHMLISYLCSYTEAQNLLEALIISGVVMQLFVEFFLIIAWKSCGMLSFMMS